MSEPGDNAAQDVQALLAVNVDDISNIDVLRQHLHEARTALQRVAESQGRVALCSEQLERSPAGDGSAGAEAFPLPIPKATLAAMLRREDELRTCEETQAEYAGETPRHAVTLV